jgi:hypothetical protein
MKRRWRKYWSNRQRKQAWGATILVLVIAACLIFLVFPETGNMIEEKIAEYQGDQKPQVSRSTVRRAVSPPRRIAPYRPFRLKRR